MRKYSSPRHSQVDACGVVAPLGGQGRRGPWGGLEEGGGAGGARAPAARGSSSSHRADSPGWSRTCSSASGDECPKQRSRSLPHRHCHVVLRTSDGRNYCFLR